MKLFDEINEYRLLVDFDNSCDLLIIDKEMERRMYIEESVLKSMDISDAFDIEVMVVDKLDKFRLFKEV